MEVCVILAEAAFLWENLTRSGGHDVVVVGVRTDQQWASQKQPSRSISLINWFGIPISFRFPLFILSVESSQILSPCLCPVASARRERVPKKDRDPCEVFFFRLVVDV